MSKKQKIDFVLRDNSDTEIIFRFRPRNSSCHSFNDKPPKSWDEVYKVYYSYSIIERSKDGDYFNVLFDCSCDECSVIDDIGARAKYISEGKKEVKISCKNDQYVVKLLGKEVHPIGYGVSWKIDEIRNSKNYRIEMWNWNNTGYRFTLSTEKLKEFGDFLLGCCEYMLAHGCPI